MYCITVVINIMGIVYNIDIFDKFHFYFKENPQDFIFDYLRVYEIESKIQRDQKV